MSAPEPAPGAETGDQERLAEIERGLYTCRGIPDRLAQTHDARKTTCQRCRSFLAVSGD